MALRAQPGSRIRTRVLSDGTQSDETVPVDPDIMPWLVVHMQAIVKHDGRELLLAGLSSAAIAGTGGRSRGGRAN